MGYRRRATDYILFHHLETPRIGGRYKRIENQIRAKLGADSMQNYMEWKWNSSQI